jgi:hypothetical protein
MIDTEVRRLRRLRNSALRARALALALDSQPTLRSRVPGRGAVACWLVARVVTGRLRSHPYLRYQRGPSSMRLIYERWSARVVGVLAHRRGKGLEIFSVELQRLVRELADARALTWSADLSDTFGRSQAQIERLRKDLHATLRSQTGSYAEADSRNEPAAGASLDNCGNVAANWPYLTF